MIVISTFNPDSPRSTTDEEHLTTMFSAIVRYRNRHALAFKSAQDEITQEYHLRQKENAARLLEQLIPLLGLTVDEAMEIIREDFEKCRMTASGKI
jgi:hypothetical protein